jgi:hypothetical protein
MPYKKRAIRHRREAYSKGHLFQLKFGFSCEILGDTFGRGDAFDEEAAREAWNLLRLPILREYAAEHPCRRPAAWWWFDAPELRRRVDGGRHPCEDPTREIGVYRGRPEWYCTEDDFRAVYESEPAYLARLQLLTKGEIAHLEDHPELLEPVSHERRLFEAIF